LWTSVCELSLKIPLAPLIKMDKIEARDEALINFFSDGDKTIVNYLDSVFGFLYRRCVKT
jgi:hypothetical protein